MKVEVSQLLCVKYIFNYLTSFVFYRLLHDILSLVHIFVFTVVKYR